MVVDRAAEKKAVARQAGCHARTKFRDWRIEDLKSGRRARGGMLGEGFRSMSGDGVRHLTIRN